MPKEVLLDAPSSDLQLCITCITATAKKTAENRSLLKLKQITLLFCWFFWYIRYSCSPCWHLCCARAASDKLVAPAVQCGPSRHPPDAALPIPLPWFVTTFILLTYTSRLRTYASVYGSQQRVYIIFFLTFFSYFLNVELALRHPDLFAFSRCQRNPPRTPTSSSRFSPPLSSCTSLPPYLYVFIPLPRLLPSSLMFRIKLGRKTFP